MISLHELRTDFEEAKRLLAEAERRLDRTITEQDIIRRNRAARILREISERLQTLEHESENP